MPAKPLGRCPVCGRRSSGRCESCAAAAERARGSAASRGYGTQHEARFRRRVLTRDPVCVLCRRALSTVADHFPLSRRELVAAGMDPNDPRHGRGLCARCHSKATAELQPGGWNRPD